MAWLKINRPKTEKPWACSYSKHCAIQALAITLHLDPAGKIDGYAVIGPDDGSCSKQGPGPETL